VDRLLAFAIAALVVGYGLMYAAVKDVQLWSVFRGEPVPAAPSTSSSAPAGVGPNAAASGPAATSATAQLKLVLALIAPIPGWSLGAICGAGSVSASEHPYCNAADILGPPLVLALVQTTLVAAGVAGGPVHCVIGPDSACDKGRIQSREDNFAAHCYTGPNSHQSHVHVSAWPSVGGGC
jgi:hypothetical protein